VKVTLVDPKERLVQRLRLHQVATGQRVSEPAYRKLLGAKVAFVQDAAEMIDCERSRVELAGSHEPLPFDRLIYTVGSGVDLSTVPGASEHAHSVTDLAPARGLGDALRHLPDDALVAVVGGGMTGLEVASEIATTYPTRPVKLVTGGELGGWLSERGGECLREALA